MGWTISREGWGGSYGWGMRQHSPRDITVTSTRYSCTIPFEAYASSSNPTASVSGSHHTGGVTGLSVSTSYSNLVYWAYISIPINNKNGCSGSFWISMNTGGSSGYTYYCSCSMIYSELGLSKPNEAPKWSVTPVVNITGTGVNSETNYISQQEGNVTVSWSGTATDADGNFSGYGLALNNNVVQNIGNYTSASLTISRTGYSTVLIGVAPYDSNSLYGTIVNNANSYTVNPDIPIPTNVTIAGLNYVSGMTVPLGFNFSMNCPLTGGFSLQHESNYGSAYLVTFKIGTTSLGTATSLGNSISKDISIPSSLYNTSAILTVIITDGWQSRTLAYNIFIGGNFYAWTPYRSASTTNMQLDDSAGINLGVIQLSNTLNWYGTVQIETQFSFDNVNWTVLNDGGYTYNSANTTSSQNITNLINKLINTNNIAKNKFQESNFSILFRLRAIIGNYSQYSSTVNFYWQKPEITQLYLDYPDENSNYYYSISGTVPVCLDSFRIYYGADLHGYNLSGNLKLVYNVLEDNIVGNEISLPNCTISFSQPTLLSNNSKTFNFLDLLTISQYSKELELHIICYFELNYNNKTVPLFSDTSLTKQQLNWNNFSNPNYAAIYFNRGTNLIESSYLEQNLQLLENNIAPIQWNFNINIKYAKSYWLGYQIQILNGTVEIYNYEENFSQNNLPILDTMDLLPPASVNYSSLSNFLVSLGFTHNNYQNVKLQTINIGQTVKPDLLDPNNSKFPIILKNIVGINKDISHNQNYIVKFYLILAEAYSDNQEDTDANISLTVKHGILDKTLVFQSSFNTFFIPKFNTGGVDVQHQ